MEGPVALRRSAPKLDPSGGAIDASRAFGLYVHVPFCSVRCPYCDFAIDTRPQIPHDAYADAVVGELRARAPWLGRGDEPAEDGRPRWRSIYFGGGTPALWRVDCLARVIAQACASFGRPSGGLEALEVTLEANPGDVDDARLDALRAAGVNRLSLGLQSFDDRLLAAIGRHHDAAAGPAAFSAARKAGFDRISCDLMYGLPGQSLDDWRRAVDALVALGPDHVSAYALTVEPGTPFANLDRAGKLPRPDDEAVAAMAEWGHAALEAAGYERYEVSSYARLGRRAVHNTLYWTGGAYLGVGCGAASFRPLADGTGLRFTNPRATDTYLRACARDGGSPTPASVERRTADDLAKESLWLGLRLREGIDRAGFARHHGRDPLTTAAQQAAAQRCAAAGWLELTPDRLRLTAAGWLFADEVAARLWP